ncbi:hypothetical protein C8N26_1736 [Tenacibaculum lutimaris]|uniref:Natural product n=1 Tax=Tenacibaculum lutimaris TaxID=285258 RepID=A0A420DZS7_9FLAO|nr:hypothetical protein [Tenacibaculum lutimaris]RKF03351.1 hypothetical protein C8N26_1736 [Tenacibaculum lutimaris]
MKQKFLNISDFTILSKEQLKNVTGSAGVDLSKCACDCAGNVTGPIYCELYFACPHEHTC